jgi:hypothetical protein
MRPEPKRAEPRKPALNCVMTARPFARDRTSGGITLSGPNAWAGSTNDARILDAFLHSPKFLCQFWDQHDHTKVAYSSWTKAMDYGVRNPL